MTSSGIEAVFESANDALIATDAADVVAIWSRSAENLLGYTAGEMAGRPLLDIVPEHSRGEHDRIFNRAIGGQRVDAVDTRWIARDGRVLLFSLNAIATQRADGKADGVLRVLRPLPDFQHAAALQRERELAARYLDTAQVILLQLDLHGKITMVNRYACEFLGWTADELVGRDWIGMCLPPRIAAELRNKFHNLIAGDLSVVENPVLTRSGEERLIEWRNSVLRDAQGRAVGTLSSGADITERTRAAEALRTAEERMRFAMEAAHVGVWDMNYGTGRVHWSEVLEAQFGLQAGTFEGTFEAFIARIDPEDRAKTLDAIQEAARSGEDFSIQHRTTWPDGTTHWLHGAGRVHFGPDGRPWRAAGIAQDITEQKSAEAELERLGDEIRSQRVRVFKATMTTVQDIVNNFLNHMQLIHLECEGQAPAVLQAQINKLVQETAQQLKLLADLDTIKEKNMAIGVGIEYPGSTA